MLDARIPALQARIAAQEAELKNLRAMIADVLDAIPYQLLSDDQRVKITDIRYSD